MSTKALQETDYETIKAYILFPEDTEISFYQRELLDRVISASKLLDKNPIQRYAVNIHHAKFPDITRRTAYSDLRLAAKLFNSLHTFDYDLWHTWLIKDIVRNIQICENNNDHNSRRVIAMEHANLLKAIGERPVDLPDPGRNEKHQFYILIQNNNQQIKIDVNKLGDIPVSALEQLNKAIFGGQEISQAEAENLIGT